ncbi:YceI family protein [Peribacillus sp. SCS-37]|uniref:YceI family protein n=1 Tax=Paraperibacillus esterisolvens TaxID=3115296 RepID=UPI003905E155
MAKAKWALDPAHSSVDFSVKHMMFAKVKGNFNKFDAVIEADPEDLTTAEIDFTIDTTSIDTRNEDRDAHLRGADFFDTEQFGAMTFKSGTITRTQGSSYTITGDLTLHGVTRQETFLVTYEGSGSDPWGNIKAGFSVEGKINRSDYGLTWNTALETGGVLVGDQINISLQLQAAQA